MLCWPITQLRNWMRKGSESVTFKDKTIVDDHCLSATLSLNAAISASVVLASRLEDNAQVFALLFFAITWFALFPMLRHKLPVSLSLFPVDCLAEIGRTARVNYTPASRNMFSQSLPVEYYSSNHTFAVSLSCYICLARTGDLGATV